MLSVFEELKDKIIEANNVKSKAYDIAQILKSFEFEKIPFVEGSKHNSLLKKLDFLDEGNKNNNPYDYTLPILSKKAFEFYKKLKEEGYYTQSNK